MTTKTTAGDTTADTTASPLHSRGGPSRRTLIHGTAWAVPAVIVATAAPAVAASSSACPRLIGAQGAISSAIFEMTLGFDVRDPSYVLTITNISPATSGYPLPPPKNLTVDNITAAATVHYTFNRPNSPRQNVTFTFKLTKGDVVCTSDLYSVTFLA